VVSTDWKSFFFFNQKVNMKRENVHLILIFKNHTPKMKNKSKKRAVSKNTNNFFFFKKIKNCQFLIRIIKNRERKNGVSKKNTNKKKTNEQKINSSFFQCLVRFISCRLQIASKKFKKKSGYT